MGAFDFRGLAVVGALAFAPCAWADVKAVLQKLGKKAQAQENAAPCSHRETTTVDYGDTACGRIPVGIEIEGEGVAVFIEARFRTRSVLDGHARVAAPQKK